MKFRTIAGTALAVVFAVGAAGVAGAADIKKPAKPVRMELPVQFQYVPSAEPLTTDKVLLLDPEQPNPHRQRWILERHVDLEAFKVVELPNGRFGVHANALNVSTKSFVRGPGPWYQPLVDFPCSDQPVSWFATLEGTRKAADQAESIWQAELLVNKIKLEILLSRINEKNSNIALQVGIHVFQNWLHEVTEYWRTRVASKVRLAEWDSYRAAAQDLCAKRKPDEKPVAKSWDSMMEPVPTTGTPKILARAPARRWAGMFTVRMNVRVGSKTLNGQFLVDSAARTSIISPDWLKSQGVLPLEVETTGAPFERVEWGVARLHEGEGHLARRVQVDGAQIGDWEVPIRDFLLFETSFFGQPETVGSCCSGILGSDFLRRVVAEFITEFPSSTSELKLMAPERFRPDQGNFVWFEAATTFMGEPASPCTVSTGKQEWLGVIWNTGEELPISLNPPLKPEKGATYNISCGGQAIGSGFEAGASPYPKSRREGIAADVGIPVLARGSFIMDLPHGRVWLDRPSLGKSLPVNRSGLGILYVFFKGDRVLKVTSIQPGSPAAELKKAGLKPGMFLTEVDGKPAEDIDEWEVRQRLAGVYGDTVTLKWNQGKRSVIAPLRVR